MNANDIVRNLNIVKDNLPDGVKLVAVSKFHPAAYIQAAYDAGQRIFGESREQELALKVKELPDDIRWHFIGHLQTNKVKLIAPYISMIETVDSLRLLREIDKQGAACGRTIKVLLELHIAQEATKYGLSLDECRGLLAEGAWRTMNNVKICGLMMMASNTDDAQQVEREFSLAAAFFDEIKQEYFSGDADFCERSWGMSHDYELAAKHRSTMVRVGTFIFGPRVY